MKDWVDAIDHVIEAFKRGDWPEGLDGLINLRGVFNVLTQDAFSFARDLLAKDVTETVEGIANEVARQWRAGEFNGDRDAVMQSIEESCDAACTYTQKAQFILAIARHDEAYVEEYGELPDCKEGIPWSALATMALRREVIEQLQREPGVDLDEDPPDDPLVDCGECGDWKPSKDGVCDDCREDVEEDDKEEEDD